MTETLAIDAPALATLREQVGTTVGADELRTISRRLEVKSQAMRALVSEEPAGWDGDHVYALLRLSFATRRRARQIAAAVDPGLFSQTVAGLLDETEPVDDRMNRFDGAFDGPLSAALVQPSAPELASELLHFTLPDRYWLWTTWIWDRRARTGALALVAGLVDEPDRETPGAAYLAVGRRMALIDETARATGGWPVAGPFALDVTLAVLYALYVHAVIQSRITREFARVLPPVPELARRLLGAMDREG